MHMWEHRLGLGLPLAASCLPGSPFARSEATPGSFRPEPTGSRTTRVQTGNGGTIVSTVDTQYAPCACSPLGKMSAVSQPYGARLCYGLREVVIEPRPRGAVGRAPILPGSVHRLARRGRKEIE
jgi:hypothetical protein